MYVSAGNCMRGITVNGLQTVFWAPPTAEPSQRKRIRFSKDGPKELRGRELLIHSMS